MSEKEYLYWNENNILQDPVKELILQMKYKNGTRKHKRRKPICRSGKEASKSQ